MLPAGTIEIDEPPGVLLNHQVRYLTLWGDA
jgi:hypothetical protein